MQQLRVGIETAAENAVVIIPSGLSTLLGTVHLKPAFVTTEPGFVRPMRDDDIAKIFCGVDDGNGVFFR